MNILQKFALVAGTVILIAATIIKSPTVTSERGRRLQEIAYYDAKAATVIVETAVGYGSGILVTRDHTNYVWTDAHVILNPATVDVIKNGETWSLKVADVKVTLSDGRTNTAEVIAYSLLSDKRDLALLRVKGRDWVTTSVRFYHGAPPAIGTPVFHVGNFHGPHYHHSLVFGYVSYVSRVLESGTYDQMDCSVAPGSSGGGFFLMDGRVIGLQDATNPGGSLALVTPIRTMEEWAAEKNVLFALP